MLTSVRANRLSAGQLVLARVWMGNGKYAYVQTRATAVPDGKLKSGTEGFAFERLENVPSAGAVKVKFEGRTRRVTFLALQTPTQLALPAPVAEVAAEAAPAAKRARKPLTEAQKARKNELARARRAELRDSVC